MWDISQEICFPALNRSCSVEVLPCVPEHDVEDLSKDAKENNAENVTDVTPITPSTNGARLTSHKSLDNDLPTTLGECDNVWHNEIMYFIQVMCTVQKLVIIQSEGLILLPT